MVKPVITGDTTDLQSTRHSQKWKGRPGPCPFLTAVFHHAAPDGRETAHGLLLAGQKMWQKVICLVPGELAQVEREVMFSQAERGWKNTGERNEGIPPPPGACAQRGQPQGLPTGAQMSTKSARLPIYNYENAVGMGITHHSARHKDLTPCEKALEGS